MAQTRNFHLEQTEEEFFFPFFFFLTRSIAVNVYSFYGGLFFPTNVIVLLGDDVKICDVF